MTSVKSVIDGMRATRDQNLAEYNKLKALLKQRNQQVNHLYKSEKVRSRQEIKRCFTFFFFVEKKLCRSCCRKRVTIISCFFFLCAQQVVALSQQKAKLEAQGKLQGKDSAEEKADVLAFNNKTIVVKNLKDKLADLDEQVSMIQNLLF